MAVATTPEDLSNLMTRIGGGDRTALRQLYDATSAKLFGVCLRILSDREESEDVLQDVYVTIWRRADRFDSARASVMTWLSTIARNRAIDRLRARGPLAYAGPVDELEIADGADSAETLLASRASGVAPPQFNVAQLLIGVGASAMDSAATALKPTAVVTAVSAGQSRSGVSVARMRKAPAFACGCSSDKRGHSC